MGDGVLSEHQKRIRKKQGHIPDEQPDYDAAAYAVLTAFNHISRGRDYHQTGHPRPIGMNLILDYIRLFPLPMPLWLFCECIMHLDDLFIDSVNSKK